MTLPPGKRPRSRVPQELVGHRGPSAAQPGARGGAARRDHAGGGLPQARHCCCPPADAGCALLSAFTSANWVYCSDVINQARIKEGPVWASVDA